MEPVSQLAGSTIRKKPGCGGGACFVEYAQTVVAFA